MEWFRFKREASINCTTTATPTPIDDWTTLALRQAENSSKQRPGLSVRSTIFFHHPATSLANPSTQRIHNLGL